MEFLFELYEKYTAGLFEGEGKEQKSRRAARSKIGNGNS
jgi:hypothetical protein